jgi:hypothetical protein
MFIFFKSILNKLLNLNKNLYITRAAQATKRTKNAIEFIVASKVDMICIKFGAAFIPNFCYASSIIMK